MRRHLTALIAASAALMAAPAAASALDCPGQTAAPVFAPWNDLASYVLVPGGDAESPAGWALDGASVAPGNEPWSVTGSGASHVELPAGASATTGVQCSGVEHPTLRFFARSSGTGLLSSLKVEALVGGLALPIGVVAPSASWTPTPVYLVALNLLSLVNGDRVPVRFRFTPVGAGSWSVDDVHVDPYRGGGG